MSHSGYKVVLVGETDVGKSSFFVWFRDGKFVENLAGTVGLDQTTQKVEILAEHSENGVQEIKIQLWDTAGVEKSGRLTSNHYRHACAVILMYDVTELMTFNALEHWLKEANNYTKEKPCLFFIVGNKIDCMPGDIDVTEKTVASFAREKEIDAKNIFQISVKNEEGCQKLLSYIGCCLSGFKPPPPRQEDPFKKYEEKKCNC